MLKNSKTFGLSPQKLAQVWNIGHDTEKTDETTDQEDKKAQVLHDLLNEILSISSSVMKSYPNDQANLQSIINSIAGKSINMLLMNPETNIAMIRKVKDHGKRLSGKAESKTEYHAANTIYYAAVASALVYHDRKITKFSYKDLEKYFRRLSNENWIPEYLRNLFIRTREYCCKRRNSS
jgi:hypothetical protein